MRILAVAELYPWPAVDGYRQRLNHMLRGLATVGELEVFCLADARRQHAVPPFEGINQVVTAPRVDRSAREWLADWFRGDLPRRMLSIDWTEAHRQLGAWAPEVDLVWYSHIDSWHAMSDLFADTPAIVDFDNLENLLLRLRRRTPPRVDAVEGIGGVASELGRWVTSRAFDVVDERRWSDVQRRCAGAVNRVVVCSPLDVQRSGLPNAVVLPNGADDVPDVDVDRRRLRGRAPTMTFVGALDYEPNTDAVVWFATEVLPLIRARVSEARFVVVGRGVEALRLDVPLPGVEILGEVDDLRAQLDRTDVSVVPIRLGAGTRLKVIEAMAHHLPMVTTRVGCEGIALNQGVHALIADDPRRFADACLRLLGDGGLRQSLSERAAELFVARYRWSAIEDSVGTLAEEVIVEGPTR